MTAPPSILVVDDNEPLLRSMLRLLEEAGYDVRGATTAERAIALARAQPPELILLDVMLPDVLGTHLVPVIRATPELASTSVVLLSSSRVEPDQQAEGLDHGADDYIARPVASAELLARVRSLLRQRELHQRLRASEARLRSLIDRQLDAVVVLTVDGVVCFANPAAEALFERSADALVGKPVGFSVGADAPREIAIPRQDGRACLAEMSVADFSWEGTPAWIVTLRDVTERRRAEERLRQSEALLQIAERVARLGAWSIEFPSLRVHWSEQTRALHELPAGSRVAPADLLGFYVEEDRPRIQQAFAACVNDGEPFFEEVRFRTATGRELWVRSMGEAVRDEQGVLVRVQGGIQDIDELKSVQARLSRTLESIADPFLSVDAQWRVTYANAEAERLLGRPRDALLGEDFWEEFSAAAGTPMEEALRRASEERAPVSVEEYLPALGRWFEARACGSEDGLSLHLVDVSERRRHREELRQSEERFRLLARATNDAIWDWDLATDAIWWNEGITALFGYDRAAMDPSVDSWLTRVHEDDSGRVMASLREAIAEGAAIWSTEYRFLRQDGTFAFVCDRAHILRDADGSPQRIIGGMMDISERRHAERKLREQATLLDSARDAILRYDLDHRIEYWNQGAERLYGWTAEEALGQRGPDLLHSDPVEVREITSRVLADGEWFGELEQRNKRGDTRIVEGRWSLVRDGSGEPSSFLVINSDITQRKALEAQFFRAQRMESVGTLAGGIAHDLNNVLAPILLSLAAMREGADEATTSEISVIESCALRGAQMVRQLLSFARGTADEERGPIDPSGIVNEVYSIVRDSFPKGIQCEVSIAPDLRRINANPTQIHQLLTNLCVNARDAMPGGGALTLSAHNVSVDEGYSGMNIEAQAGDYILLSVEDTGEGIPDDLMERIFEPFFTTKEVGKGTGLGLSTVHAIARSYGGFVRVRSVRGEGTRFDVYLPAERGPSGDGASSSVREALPRGRGELILVVDDEDSICTVVRRTLERSGYRVMTASNGADAVACFQQAAGEVDLVLTDMAMPVMDGPATIVALRAIEPTVRIVGSSGLETDEYVVRSTGEGVMRFVPKPYSAETLLRTLRAALDEPAWERAADR
ncbi:MAG: PAS domain S-box protein [Deltaproteobacteria bacterium]|nr:PAS domain S-box protein [Deltaproteobacteria bacterium]